MRGVRARLLPFWRCNSGEAKPSAAPTPFSLPAIRRLLGDRRVSIVDGGARGELFAPVNQIESQWRRVVRFEPDAVAEVSEDGAQAVVRRALWSTDCTIDLHLTRTRSCSSVYPPDKRLLSGFVDLLGTAAREVEEQQAVLATSIDAAFRDAGLSGPDFIKLDVHSAEYEALSGASRALAESTVGILVEVWPLPIHRGQHSFAELDELVQQAGFVPFDVAVGCWPRKPPVAARYLSRPQAVQFEMLYLLDASGDCVGRHPPGRVATLIGFAALFGHVTYAMQVALDAVEHRVLTNDDGDEIISGLVALSRISPTQAAISAITQRVRRRLAVLELPVAGR